MEAKVVGMMRSEGAPHLAQGAGWSETETERRASKTAWQLSQ
jgi:hypothetical protein